MREPTLRSWVSQEPSITPARRFFFAAKSLVREMLLPEDRLPDKRDVAVNSRFELISFLVPSFDDQCKPSTLFAATRPALWLRRFVSTTGVFVPGTVPSSPCRDRKSVVEGKSVDLGGRRI